MEPDDIFSDQVQVSRPELIKLVCAVSVTIVSNPCDIVGKSIQPYINNMPLIKIYRNSPLKRSSGHTKVLESRKQEVVHHLIFSGLRLNKFRMGVDILNEPVRIFAQLQEIRLFLRWLYFPSAVRTFSVYKLAFCKKGFTWGTVKSFVVSLVNISLLIKLFKNLLYLSFVVRVRCADKLIVRSIHQIPDPFDLSCHVVHKLFRRHTLLGRF